MGSVTYNKLLRKKGFVYYLIAEFLGAYNDNILRMVLGLMALEIGWTKGGSDAISSMGVATVGAVFIAPFILFSGIAGNLSDTFNKRRVLIVTKCLEVFTMSLSFIILPMDVFWLSLILLFLMAAQSTFFSPAKYGILPEIFAERYLSRANGMVEMTTYTAIILGLFTGGSLFYFFQFQKIYIAMALFGVSIIGCAAIFFIPETPYPGSQSKISWHPYETIVSGTRKIFSNPRLIMTVAGITWFWFLGSMMQSLLMLMGAELLKLDSFFIGTLLVFLGIGIAIGSLLAGRLSGDRIELGLVPIGAIGIGIAAVLIHLTASSYYLVIMPLLLMGMSAGLFIVPLNANLQYLAGVQEKGKLIATGNVFSMGAVMTASAVLPILHDVIGLYSDKIVMIIGIGTFAATAYAAFKLPMVLMRCLLWVLTHTLYKINVRGRHNIPETGPALLVSNHVSYVDGFLIGGTTQRHVLFMLHHAIYHVKFLEPFFKMMKVIPVYRGRKVVQTFERAREALQNGQLVCIFAEGGITRNGHILPFQKGLEKIAEGLSVPIIPVNIDGVWGSAFSYDKGRYFWKLPKRFPYPVTVSFGKPLPPGTPKDEIRQAVKELESEAFPLRDTVNNLLPLRFIKSAKSAFWRMAMVDSTGMKLRFGKVLIGSLVLSKKIRQKTLGEDMVGIMLPSSVGGALANLAVSLTGKVAVNLNFTLGKEAFESSIQQCNIKTIITSRKLLEKIDMPERNEMFFLEDVRGLIKPIDRIKAVLLTLLPSRLILKFTLDRNITPTSIATILFSSGSTGIPKGIMLSHRNILADIEAGTQAIPFNNNEKFMGALPFFHTFGYTVCLWFTLIRKFSVIYHTNPTDAKTIGQMASEYKATFMVATPTFYQLYTRFCDADQFKSLRLAIVGAEKLRENVALAFKDKFGLDLYEGYGATELSPVVSVSIPDVICEDGWRQVGHKHGAVGTSLPGVATKIVDRETMEDMPLGEPGMLLVKGGTTMVGYLNQPELTRESFYGSWYITGDIAVMDEGGFIKIVDRVSRFSKIGGEMVPHINIEDRINDILGAANSVVVTVSSARKGEALAVLYVHETINENHLWEELKKSEIPNLWLPKPESFIRVNQLPVMASGKCDIQKAKGIAQARLGG